MQTDTRVLGRAETPLACGKSAEVHDLKAGRTNVLEIASSAASSSEASAVFCFAAIASEGASVPAERTRGDSGSATDCVTQIHAIPSDANKAAPASADGPGVTVVRRFFRPTLFVPARRALLIEREDEAI